MLDIRPFCSERQYSPNLLRRRGWTICSPSDLPHLASFSRQESDNTGISANACRCVESVPVSFLA